MSAELERFRDYCRKRTEPYDGATMSAPCRGTVFGARARGPQHGWCGSDTCRCQCHAPTTAELALWQQLANELDAWLNRPTTDTTIPDDAMLWEETL